MRPAERRVAETTVAMYRPLERAETVALHMPTTATEIAVDPCRCGHPSGSHKQQGFYPQERPQPCMAGDCDCRDFRDARLTRAANVLIAVLVAGVTLMAVLMLVNA